MQEKNSWEIFVSLQTKVLDILEDYSKGIRKSVISFPFILHLSSMIVVSMSWFLVPNYFKSNISSNFILVEFFAQHPFRAYLIVYFYSVFSSVFPLVLVVQHNKITFLPLLIQIFFVYPAWLSFLNFTPAIFNTYNWHSLDYFTFYEACFLFFLLFLAFICVITLFILSFIPNIYYLLISTSLKNAPFFTLKDLHSYDQIIGQITDDLTPFFEEINGTSCNDIALFAHNRLESFSSQAQVISIPIALFGLTSLFTIFGSQWVTNIFRTIGTTG